MSRAAIASFVGLGLAVSASLLGVPQAGAAGPASGAAVVTGTPSATHSKARATTVHRVTPLTKQGHLRGRYEVARRAKGYCWTTSFVHGRLYRCFRGNLIQDPCWKLSGRPSVVCLGVPWSTSVTRLKLTRRLPPTAAYGGRIWGLRRLDGVGGGCLASSGTGELIGSRPVTYYCHRGWVLVGNPDRTDPLWTIATAKRVGDHYELRGRRPLGTAWRPVRHAR